jgi:N-acetyltransferase 10
VKRSNVFSQFIFTSANRDALFSYHKLSEAFLQKLTGLYTSVHYKNTPNDLQMLSDAPAHSLFILLYPSAEKDADSLPDVLAVVQVALEGKILRKAVDAQLARGHQSAGDLIPWTISQQFGDSKFAQLSGARVVRIAVHPFV